MNEILQIFQKLGYFSLLENRGLIVNTNDEYFLTDKGKAFLKDNSDFNWIYDWLKLWPTNLKKQIGYTVSGNTDAVFNRMKRFQARFGYSPTTIIKATQKYLKEQENANWEYTKKNSKFILDKDGSLLEDYCKKIIDPALDTNSGIEFL